MRRKISQVKENAPVPSPQEIASGRRAETLKSEALHFEGDGEEMGTSDSPGGARTKHSDLEEAWNGDGKKGDFNGSVSITKR